MIHCTKPAMQRDDFVAHLLGASSAKFRPKIARYAITSIPSASLCSAVLQHPSHTSNGTVQCTAGLNGHIILLHLIK